MAALRTRGSIAQSAILAKLGLQDDAARATTELPQGRRKLLDIALAMVGRSAVLCSTSRPVESAPVKNSRSWTSCWKRLWQRRPPYCSWSTIWSWSSDTPSG